MVSLEQQFMVPIKRLIAEFESTVQFDPPVNDSPTHFEVPFLPVMGESHRAIEVNIMPKEVDDPIIDMESCVALSEPQLECLGYIVIHREQNPDIVLYSQSVVAEVYCLLDLEDRPTI